MVLEKHIPHFHHEDYSKLFKNYLDEINVINMGYKKLKIIPKEWGNTKPTPTENDVNADGINTPPAESDTPADGQPPANNPQPPTPPEEAVTGDAFIEEYDKIRYLTNFYELRLRLEGLLSRKGIGALTINVDNNGNVFHQLADVSEHVVNQIGNLIKVTLITDTWVKNGIGYDLRETYDLKTKTIERVVMSGVAKLKADYCPYPFKAKDTFSDLDFIPVVIFKNNWDATTDYKGLQSMLNDTAVLMKIIPMYAKSVIPRILYRNFQNSSEEIEDIEKQFVGELEDLKVFVALQDSDTEFSTPFTTMAPANTIDKHIATIEKMFHFINRFSKTNKEVSDKGSVQQSTSEIGEMNAVPEMYQAIKEHLRLRRFSRLADLTNKYMIAYTPFTGDEEAIYDAEFEDLEEKDTPPMPLNPFQVGNTMGLVQPGGNDDGTGK